MFIEKPKLYKGRLLINASFQRLCDRHKVIAMPLLADTISDEDAIRINFLHQHCQQQQLTFICFALDTLKRPEQIDPSIWQTFTPIDKLPEFAQNIDRFEKKKKLGQRARYETYTELLKAFKYLDEAQLQQLDLFMKNCLVWKERFDQLLILTCYTPLSSKSFSHISEYLDSIPVRKLQMVESMSHHENTDSIENVIWTLCMPMPANPNQDEELHYLSKKAFRKTLENLLSRYRKQNIIVVLADYLDSYNRNLHKDEAYRLISQDKALNQRIAEFQAIFAELCPKSERNHQFLRWDHFIHDANFSYYKQRFKKIIQEPPGNHLTELLRVATRHVPYQLSKYATHYEQFAVTYATVKGLLKLEDADHENIIQSMRTLLGSELPPTQATHHVYNALKPLIEQSRRYTIEECAVACMQIQRYYPAVVIYDGDPERGRVMQTSYSLPLEQLTMHQHNPVGTVYYIAPEVSKKFASHVSLAKFIQQRNESVSITTFFDKSDTHEECFVCINASGFTRHFVMKINSAEKRFADSNECYRIINHATQDYRYTEDTIALIESWLKEHNPWLDLSKSTEVQPKQQASNVLSCVSFNTAVLHDGRYSATESISSQNAFLAQHQAELEKIVTDLCSIFGCDIETARRYFDRIVLTITSLPQHYIPVQIIKGIFNNDELKCIDKALKLFKRHNILTHDNGIYSINTITQHSLQLYIESQIATQQANFAEYIITLLKFVLSYYNNVRESYNKEVKEANAHIHFKHCQAILESLLTQKCKWLLCENLYKSLEFHRKLANANWAAGTYYLTYCEVPELAIDYYEDALKFYDYPEQYADDKALPLRQQRDIQHRASLLHFHIGTAYRLTDSFEKSSHHKCLAIKLDKQCYQLIFSKPPEDASLLQPFSIYVTKQSEYWLAETLDGQQCLVKIPLPNWIIDTTLDAALPDKIEQLLSDYVGSQLGLSFGLIDATDYEAMAYLAYKFHNLAVSYSSCSLAVGINISTQPKQFSISAFYLAEAEKVLAHLATMQKHLQADGRPFIMREPTLCHGWIHYRRGIIAAKQAQFDEAIVEFKNAASYAGQEIVTRSYPNLMRDISRAMANIYMMCEQFDNAIEQLNISLSYHDKLLTATQKKYLQYRIAYDNVKIALCTKRKGLTSPAPLIKSVIISALSTFALDEYEEQKDSKRLIEHLCTLLNVYTISLALWVKHEESESQLESYYEQLTTCYNSIDCWNSITSPLRQQYIFYSNLRTHFKMAKALDLSSVDDIHDLQVAYDLFQLGCLCEDSADIDGYFSDSLFRCSERIYKINNSSHYPLPTVDRLRDKLSSSFVMVSKNSIFTSIITTDTKDNSSTATSLDFSAV